MTSGRFVHANHEGVGMMGAVRRIHSNELRRIYIKILLNQFEDKIRRDMGEKFCNKCSNIIEGNVANHLVLDCEELEIARDDIRNEDWFREAIENEIVSTDSTKIILSRFEQPGIYGLIKFFK